MTHYLIQDHDVAVFAPVGNSFSKDYIVDMRKQPDGTEKEYQITVYPGTGFDYGEDLTSYHYDDFKADILLQMADVFALRPPSQLGILQLSRVQKMFNILIAPLDFMDPIPPDMVDRLSCAYRIVPWTLDAETRFRAVGLKNVMPHIPLGLNMKLWVKLDRKKFPETMKAMGYDPDGKTFNILVVAANQFLRKSWSETFAGIGLFKKKHPEANTRLYIHTPVAMGGEWNMQELSKFWGIDDITVGLDNYQFVTGGYTEDTMVKVHNMADVCMMLGLEGFGMPTIQSQAVGVPVIGINACATKELVKYGVLVEPRSFVHTPSLLTNAFPDPHDVADALEMIYNNRGKSKKQAKETMEWVKQTFDWEVVMAQWKTTLESIEGDLRRECKLRSVTPPKPSPWNMELANQLVTLK